MSRMFRLLCCLTALVAGCAAHQEIHLASPYGWIAVGSRVTLHHELNIPAHQTRLFIQHGQVLNNGFDQYHPHCNFEVRMLSDEVQNIVPDEFVVTRMQEGFEEVVSINKPIKVAALEVFSLFGVFGTGRSLVSRYVHLYLKSKRQPDVMRLTCHGAFDFMWDAELPAVNEMREALGEVVTLGIYPEPGFVK